MAAPTRARRALAGSAHQSLPATLAGNPASPRRTPPEQDAAHRSTVKLALMGQRPGLAWDARFGASDSPPCRKCFGASDGLLGVNGMFRVSLPFTPRVFNKCTPASRDRRSSFTSGAVVCQNARKSGSEYRVVTTHRPWLAAARPLSSAARPWSLSWPGVGEVGAYCSGSRPSRMRRLRRWPTMRARRWPFSNAPALLAANSLSASSPKKVRASLRNRSELAASCSRVPWL